MSARYEDFLTEVMPYVRDCPEFVAVNALRNAMIEFCDKSMLWQYEVDPIDTVAGTTEYTLALPNGTGLARIMDLFYNGHRLLPKSETELAKLYVDDWRSQEGEPSYYTQRWPNVVILCPAPSTSIQNGLDLLVALRPTRASIAVDDFLFERWAEEIAFGARARLMAISGQPYTDQVQASYYRAKFDAVIGKAKIELNRGLTRATQYVRPPDLV